MKILTYFDDNLWSKYGKSWKKPSVKVLEPIILFSKDVLQETRSDLENSFQSARPCDIRFDKLCDFFLSELMDEGKDYAIASPEHVPPFELAAGKDAFCSLKEFDEDSIFDISKCAFNLLDRADIVDKLNNIQLDKGGLLDSSLIWGTPDFWTGFVGFQKYLINSRYIYTFDKNYATLVLNLFYCTSSSFSLEVVK